MGLMIASVIAPLPHNEPKEPRPYAKRTKKQRLEAVEIAYKLLNARQTVGDVKAVLAKRYGLGHRQAMSDIARARARMVKNSDRPKEEHVADAYAFYNSVVSNAKQKTNDRIYAQERIDKLFGLEAPSKYEHAGKDGGPIALATLLNAASGAIAPPHDPNEPLPNVIDVDAEIAKLEAECDGLKP